MNKTFQYSIDEGFSYYEAAVKGESAPRYFLEGYASTTDQDISGETVEYTAQQDIYAQINARAAAGKHVTVDVEHNDWRGPNGEYLNRPKTTVMPVGKIIEASLKAKGTWVKVELDSTISEFKEVWNRIKSGLLHSFSVGYFGTIKSSDKRHIFGVNLANMTLTGNPINMGSGFAASLKSASAYMLAQDQQSSIEQDVAKLKEDVLILNTVVNTRNNEPKTKDKGETHMSENKDKHKKPNEPDDVDETDETNASLSSLKAVADKNEQLENQLKAVEAKQVEFATGLKAAQEFLVKKDAQIAALEKRLSEPGLKARQETMPEPETQQAKPTTPLQDIK